MNKKYLVGLYRRNSVIALVAALLSLASYTYSIITGVVSNTAGGYKLWQLFQYFTMLSGMYGELVSGFLIVFAIEGIRKKRFTYPRWLALLHYSSVICTSLVFIFATLVISQFSREKAFGSYNFNLHVICPILIFIAFLMVESRHYFGVKDSVLCMMPIVLYAVVYVYKVVFQGAWPDIYYFTTIPVPLSFMGMMVLAFAIASGIRWLNNRKNDYFKHLQTRHWDEDLDDVSVKIEAYGLGRYMGLLGDINSTNMNLDILKDMSEKYDIKLDDLAKAYTKGVVEGFKERGDIAIK